MPPEQSSGHRILPSAGNDDDNTHARRPPHLATIPAALEERNGTDCMLAARTHENENTTEPDRSGPRRVYARRIGLSFSSRIFLAPGGEGGLL